jgi:hypothetical protein
MFSGETFMKADWLRLLGLALLLSGAWQSATAQTPQEIAQLEPGTVLEGSVESSTDHVVFPTSLPGRMQAMACSTCAVKVLEMDTATRFILAGQQVSLQQMARYCSTAAGKPLTVHYRLKDSVVSLVSVLER